MAISSIASRDRDGVRRDLVPEAFEHRRRASCSASLVLVGDQHAQVPTAGWLVVITTSR